MSFAFFGELLLRLTPALPQQKLVRTKNLDVNFAGAESNVASSLSRLGHKTTYISKLPDNPLGDAAISNLNSYGIETDKVIRGGNRIGTYFIELGSSIRPSRVVYDRAHSAISEIAENEFDWEKLLAGYDWLCLSGITPALSEQCAKETIKAAAIARKIGVNVSFDLNFRRSLWQNANQAKQYFEAVLENTTLVFGNSGVLGDVFGWSYSGENELEKTVAAAQDIYNKFNTKAAFSSRKHHSANSNTLAGIFCDENGTNSSTEYTVDILDRFGTGDAFAAGVLHGLQKQWSNREVINFGAAALALSHTIQGDQHTSTEDEIAEVAAGNISGHVIR